VAKSYLRYVPFLKRCDMSPNYYDFEYEIAMLPNLPGNEEFNEKYPDVDKVVMTFEVQESDPENGVEFRVDVFTFILVDDELVDIEDYLTMKDIRRLEKYVEESV
jgi:hypothetical protein